MRLFSDAAPDVGCSVMGGGKKTKRRKSKKTKRR